jgi:hypothetical protein
MVVSLWLAEPIIRKRKGYMVPSMRPFIITKLLSLSSSFPSMQFLLSLIALTLTINCVTAFHRDTEQKTFVGKPSDPQWPTIFQIDFVEVRD